jgi:hypothetical protein
MRHVTVLGLALSLLAGCASGGIKHADLKPFLPTLGQDEGRVYFMRKASMVGAAVQPDIYLDGKVVGVSKPGGFFYVDRPAGPHAASATTEVKRGLSFSLEGNETKFIRSFPSFGIIVGRINFELVNPEEAEKDLRELSYTGKFPAAPHAGNKDLEESAENKQGWPDPRVQERRSVVLGGDENPRPGDSSDGSQKQDAARTESVSPPDPRLPKPHRSPGDVTDTTRPSSTTWVDDSRQ